VSLELATLLAATATMGLVAGVLGLYAHTIMPGLGRTDDRTFVGAFQAIDRAINNPLFMLTFFGALLLTGAAALLHLGDDRRDVLPWLAAAGAMYLVAVVITIAVNVPLNDALKAAGDPATIDVARVRADFQERRWAAWNVVRAILSIAALLCLCWALVLHGRATAGDEAGPAGPAAEAAVR
jgi:uncharacterized membrane protein